MVDIINPPSSHGDYRYHPAASFIIRILTADIMKISARMLIMGIISFLARKSLIDITHHLAYISF